MLKQICTALTCNFCVLMPTLVGLVALRYFKKSQAVQLTVLVPIFLVTVLFVSKYLLSHFPPGISAFTSLRFWSMQAGFLIFAAFLGVFVGIMAGANDPHPSQAFAMVFGGILVFFGVMGFPYAYLLDRPEAPLFRALAAPFIGILIMGVMGIPIGIADGIFKFFRK